MDWDVHALGLVSGTTRNGTGVKFSGVGLPDVRDVVSGVVGCEVLVLRA